MLCDRPGGLCHPRETLVPSRVQGVACSPCGYRRDDDASPLAAHGLLLIERRRAAFRECLQWSIAAIHRREAAAGDLGLSKAMTI